MPYGAGTVAARQAGAATLVDPRSCAVGSIAAVFAAYPRIGPVLPAMGYGQRQIAELQATIEAADCDVVVAGTPIDLRRIVHTRHPIRQARYELRELGSPTLADVLAPLVERCQRRDGGPPRRAGRPAWAR
jgi:predicted GTPase